MLSRNRANVSPGVAPAGTVNATVLVPATSVRDVAPNKLSVMASNTPSRLKSIQASSFAASDALDNDACGVRGQACDDGRCKDNAVVIVAVPIGRRSGLAIGILIDQSTQS